MSASGAVVAVTAVVVGSEVEEGAPLLVGVPVAESVALPSTAVVGVSPVMAPEVVTGGVTAVVVLPVSVEPELVSSPQANERMERQTRGENFKRRVPEMRGAEDSGGGVARTALPTGRRGRAASTRWVAIKWARTAREVV